jgi:hypothetical protein
MTACGAGGVLMTFMGHMGWAFEKISRGAGGNFLVILDFFFDR